MLTLFTVLNPKMGGSEADQDVKERLVIRELFPSSALHICAFHVLQAFRREVSMQKLGISKGEQETALDILQQMVYAKSEDAYNELFALLQKTAAPGVVDYFTTNWHTIHAEWIMGLKWSCGNFFNSTNNRAECLNSKLKQLVERFSSLELFVERFFAIVNTQRNEKAHKAAVMLQKNPVVPNGDEAAKMYTSLLTPYAFRYVSQELCASVAAKHKISCAIADGKVSATTADCSCSFRKAMLLPCQHIFVLREASNMPKYDKELCAERWFLDVYIANSRLRQDNVCGDNVDVQVSTRSNEKTLSAHQKFKKAAGVASKLASMASECSTNTFKERLSLLETILEQWKNGHEVDISARRPSHHLKAVVAAETTSAEHLQELALCRAAEEEGPCEELPEENIDIAECSPTPPSNAPVETCRDENSLSQACTTTSNIANIKVPTAMKRCGRPKGHMLTVVGLPRKRKRTESQRPFSELAVNEKKLAVLTWLVGAKTAAEAIKGKLIDEDCVEARPEEVHDGIRDEMVDINIVRRFFTDDAWEAVVMVTNIKKEEDWKCAQCKTELDDYESILCDWCLLWHHLPCVGLAKKPKSKLWKCGPCTAIARTKVH